MKIGVVDTSAFIAEKNILDMMADDFDGIFIPQTVIDEVTNYKDKYEWFESCLEKIQEMVGCGKVMITPGTGVGDMDIAAAAMIAKMEGTACIIHGMAFLNPPCHGIMVCSVNDYRKERTKMFLN